MKMRSSVRRVAGLVLTAGVVAALAMAVRSAYEFVQAGANGAGRFERGQERTAAIEATGTVEGTVVRIAPKLTGRVARVLVREGDEVRAGQILVMLEQTETRARVAQARAQLTTALARYEEAQAGPQPEVIRQVKAELQQAQAAREGAADAARNLARQWEQSTELKENLEAAQSRVTATQATLQAAIATWDRVKAGARPEQVREAEEAVTAAQATAERAAEEENRARLSYEGGAVARREWDRARTEKAVAAANVARARAHLADLRAGARPEELREAEQEVAAARASHEGAVTTLTNARQLYQDRLPARQRLDAARAELRAANSAAEAAQARLALLRGGTRAEVLRQLRGQVEEARAALRVEEQRERDLYVRSPIEGVVIARSVEPGEVILPAARLLEVADTHRIWMRVYLPEREYGRVKVGDRASVSTDSLPNHVFAGYVNSIAREAEYTPRPVQTKEERANLMFAVKVDVDNRGGHLLIGMPVDVHFLDGRN
jgi:HlyD family secretion protein